MGSKDTAAAEKKLVCRILGVSYSHFGNDITYGVFDDGRMVATGVSSSPGFVPHDAGGYHTKERFDALYPQGWNVSFDFSDLPAS